MLKHTSPQSGIATFGSRYIATAGYDNRVILWDANKHTALARGWHDHLANQCQFSPDGKILASSSSDYSVRLWSVPDMRLLAVCGDHQDDVESVAFHPERPWLATASRDGYVRVFDHEGKILQVMSGHTADVISVEWVRDSDELVSSSDDGTIKRWNASSGELISEFDFEGVETDTVVITQDGLIIAGNDEGQIILINGDQQKKVKAHEAGVKRLVYHAGCQALVSLSYDRRVCIWDFSEGDITLRRSAALPAVVWPRSCSFLNQDTLVFVTFGSSYAVYHVMDDLWDTSRVKPTPGVNAVLSVNKDIYTIGDAGILRKNSQIIKQLPSLCNFLASAGEHIITGGQSGKIFDAISGEVIYQHHSPLNCAAAFKRDGDDADYVAVGSYTGEAIVLKSDHGTLSPVGLIKIHNNAIKGLAANKQYIFSVCATGAAAKVDINTLTVVWSKEKAHSKIANGCVALGNLGFASVSRDLKIRVFSDDVVEIPTPHLHSIKCITASADGRYVASASYGGHFAIHDALNQELLFSNRLSTSGLSCLALAADGQVFITSAYDGEIFQVPVPQSTANKVMAQ